MWSGGHTASFTHSSSGLSLTFFSAANWGANGFWLSKYTVALSEVVSRSHWSFEMENIIMRTWRNIYVGNRWPLWYPYEISDHKYFEYGAVMIVKFLCNHGWLEVMKTTFIKDKTHAMRSRRSSSLNSFTHYARHYSSRYEYPLENKDLVYHSRLFQKRKASVLDF